MPAEKQLLREIDPDALKINHYRELIATDYRYLFLPRREEIKPRDIFFLQKNSSEKEYGILGYQNL